MVEVFKTNVADHAQAKNLVEQIHKKFTNYAANFDLNDCDKILRIQCEVHNIEALHVIHLLREHGCDAEILEDLIPFATLPLN